MGSLPLVGGFAVLVLSIVCGRTEKPVQANVWETEEADTASLLQRAGTWRLTNFSGRQQPVPAQSNESGGLSLPLSSVVAGKPSHWQRNDSATLDLNHSGAGSHRPKPSHWLPPTVLALRSREASPSSRDGATARGGTTGLKEELLVLPLVAVVLIAVACYLAAYSLCDRHAADPRTPVDGSPSAARGPGARRMWNLRRDPLGTAGLGEGQAKAGNGPAPAAAPQGPQVDAASGPLPPAQRLSRYACR